jgi:hypothetical protein
MSSVFIQDPGPRFGDPPSSGGAVSVPPEDDPDLSPYEQRKRALSRAYLYPAAPRYWEPEIPSVVAVITTPSSANPQKGSGPSLAEIERHRAAEQAAFVERLRARWINNISHL